MGLSGLKLNVRVFGFIRFEGKKAKFSEMKMKNCGIFATSKDDSVQKYKSFDLNYLFFTKMSLFCANFRHFLFLLKYIGYPRV